MSLQRQDLLLSYLKTPSVGPAGVWTRDLSSSPVLSQLSRLTGTRTIFAKANRTKQRCRTLEGIVSKI